MGREREGEASLSGLFGHVDMGKGSVRREGLMLIPRLQAWVSGRVVGPFLRWTAQKGDQPGVGEEGLAWGVSGCRCLRDSGGRGLLESWEGSLCWE